MRSPLDSPLVGLRSPFGLRQIVGDVDLVAPTFDAPTYNNPNQELIIGNLSEGGTLVWATSVTANTPTYSIAGSPPGTWGGDATHETGSVSGVLREDSVQIDVTGTTPDADEQKLTFYLYDAAGNLSNPGSVSFTADNTAPVITGVSVTAGNAELDVDWSTDTGSGTARIVAVPNGDTAPTGTEIMAGQESGGAAADADSGNITVTGTGAQTQVTLTGLTNGTAYDVYLAHEDAYGNIGTASDLNNTPTAGATLVFSDDFSSYTGSLLAQSTWEEYYEFGGGDVVVNASDHAEAQLGGSDEITINTTSAATDPDQSLKFTLRAFNSCAIVAAIRVTEATSPTSYTDFDDAYFLSIDRGGTPDVNLYKRVGGAFSSLETISPSYSAQVDDVFEVKAVGSTISVLINGTEEISVTDTDISGPGNGKGYIGLRNFVTSNPEIDNVELYEGVT